MDPWRSKPVPTRQTERPVELIAVCMDFASGKQRIAATISRPGIGMTRQVFDCGPTPLDLSLALKEVAAWVYEAAYRREPERDGTMHNLELPSIGAS